MVRTWSGEEPDGQGARGMPAAPGSTPNRASYGGKKPKRTILSKFLYGPDGKGGGDPKFPGKPKKPPKSGRGKGKGKR